jgi:hypothetical protein
MRILALVMATILTAVCLAACGGDGEEEGAPAAAVTPAAAEEGTPAAAVTPAAAEEGTPAVTPSEEGLTPGSLSSLNSYRYSMKIEMEGLESLLAEQMAALPGQDPTAMAESLKMEISGAFVAPDKAESHIQIGGVDEELALTVIGDQQWMSLGDLAIGPVQAMGDVSELDMALIVWEGFSEGAGGLTCASEKKEKVNDVATNYCGIDQATFEQLASLFGGTAEMGDIDEMSLDMWLAEDGGWPVRLRVHVAGTDETGQEFDAKVEMDITDVNEEIEIEPPS